MGIEAVANGDLVALVVSRPPRIEPGPGQESVWDYPRPPRLEHSDATIKIVLGGVTIVDCATSWRVLETAGPPVHYIDPGDFAEGTLRPCAGRSWCEWKGEASYLDVRAGGVTSPSAAWRYSNPTPPFAPIGGFVAVYAGRVDSVLLGGEEVRPQPGDFYGGWITSRVTGPFKGDPGTSRW